MLRPDESWFWVSRSLKSDLVLQRRRKSGTPDYSENACLCYKVALLKSKVNFLRGFTTIDKTA
jgi:hypothetical protein